MFVNPVLNIRQASSFRGEKKSVDVQVTDRQLRNMANRIFAGRSPKTMQINVGGELKTIIPDGDGQVLCIVTEKPDGSVRTRLFADGRTIAIPCRVNL